MSEARSIEAGNIFKVRYPFVRGKFNGLDENGPFEGESWSPGVTYEPTYDGDSRCIANGAGEIILSVVSVHKPGRYPTRIFFTRRWRDPDGREFGKPRCLCVTMEKFRRLARGYRFAYEVEPSPQPEAER